MRRDQRLDDKLVEAPVVVGQRRQIDAAVPAHQKADVRGQALQERVGDMQTGSARPRGDAHCEPRVLDVGRHGVRGQWAGRGPCGRSRQQPGPFLFAVLLPSATRLAKCGRSRLSGRVSWVRGVFHVERWRGFAVTAQVRLGGGRVRFVRRVLGGAAGSIYGVVLGLQALRTGPPADGHLRLHAGGGHVRGPGGGVPLFLTCTPDGWLDALCPSPVDYGPAGSGDRTLDLRAEFGGTR